MTDTVEPQMPSRAQQRRLLLIAVGRSLRALLFGVDLADPQTFVLAIAICVRR